MLKRYTLILVMLSTLVTGCGMTGTEILHNTLVGAQLTTDVATMMSTYPKVVNIVKDHPDYFTEEDLAKLQHGKQLVDIAMIELLKLQNVKSLSTIPDLEKLYRDLMFVWSSIARVYEADATIIMSRYDKFTAVEMMTINDLDTSLRDINYNLNDLFGDKSAFSSSKANEIVPILLKVVKVVATLAAVVGV